LRRHPARVSAAACLLACGVLTTAVPTTAGASPAGRMLAALNGARGSHGESGARLSQRLSRKSEAYARYLARHSAFHHATHLHAAGFRRVGEILALQPRGCAMRRVVRAWLHSAVHRRIILRRSYHWVGVGAATGRGGMRYWVVRFGRR
jgi:uncharacterized protein YkwD